MVMITLLVLILLIELQLPQPRKQRHRMLAQEQSISDLTSNPFIGICFGGFSLGSIAPRNGRKYNSNSRLFQPKRVAYGGLGRDCVRAGSLMATGHTRTTRIGKICYITPVTLKLRINFL